MAAVSSVWPTGEGVCSELRKVKVTKTVSYWASYERRYTTWCFSIPPRCTRYSYTRAFGDGPRNFEPWSSDVDDT
ncbi:hypothetical protein TNCV_3098451 [Trichonephila clavipes]|nr:hypothetical protein TNCV_3098451 [Trichonephila clavipes]